MMYSFVFTLQAVEEDEGVHASYFVLDNGDIQAIPDNIVVDFDTVRKVFPDEEQQTSPNTAFDDVINSKNVSFFSR